MINVAVLGYGVVGSGVVEIIKKNYLSISKRAGKEIVVKRILDIRDFPDSPNKDIITKNVDDIFNDSDIKVIVETIGGITVAYEFTKRALRQGIHVISSNKELVATHGPELLKLARENSVNYLFEASVGGGIPIIRPLNRCLAANEINSIFGILNGTTNYILTQMKKEGKEFDVALKEAQEKGYAEADPTADVEGHDACRKIAILSSIAYGQFVDYKKVYTEGITKITPIDIKYAESMNSTIKLIGMSERINGMIATKVSPVIVESTHPLAGVEDVFNAILLTGDAIGEAMFYGRGAGKLPTASAVVADVIEVVKHWGTFGAYNWDIKEENNVIDIMETETKFLVRVEVKDKNKATSEIENIYKNVEWLNPLEVDNNEELAFITEVILEKDAKDVFAKISNLDSVGKVLNTIRIFN